MGATPTREPTLRNYLRDLARIEPLKPGEEFELGRRVREGDRAALNRLVEANLRFVVAYAKRYRGLGLPFQDLINAGNVGLIEGAKRYDPAKGVKFITYGVWWIKQAILHALSEQNSLFHVPPKQAALQLRLGRAENALRTALQRAPTHAELAEELRITEREVEDLLAHRGEEVALDAMVDGEHGLLLVDKLEQHLVPATDHAAFESGFRSSVRQLLHELDDKERTVVALRYGLDDDEPRTLQEVGERLGLSRERVRQIESAAFGKLRRNIRARRLLGHLN